MISFSSKTGESVTFARCTYSIGNSTMPWSLWREAQRGEKTPFSMSHFAAAPATVFVANDVATCSVQVLPWCFRGWSRCCCCYCRKPYTKRLTDEATEPYKGSALAPVVVAAAEAAATVEAATAQKKAEQTLNAAAGLKASESCKQFARRFVLAVRSCLVSSRDSESIAWGLFVEDNNGGGGAGCGGNWQKRMQRTLPPTRGVQSDECRKELWQMLKYCCVLPGAFAMMNGNADDS